MGKGKKERERERERDMKEGGRNKERQKENCPKSKCPIQTKTKIYGNIKCHKKSQKGERLHK